MVSAEKRKLTVLDYIATGVLVLSTALMLMALVNLLPVSIGLGVFVIGVLLMLVSGAINAANKRKVAGS